VVPGPLPTASHDHNARPDQFSIPGNVSDRCLKTCGWHLQQARDDNRVKAIVLEIDSPGGEVDGLRSDLQWLVTKARARQTGRGLHGFADCVRRYYISPAAGNFNGQRDPITGSIGCDHSNALNYEQCFNKIGLASVVFKSGKFKRHFERSPAMTPDTRGSRVRYANLRQVSCIVSQKTQSPGHMLRNYRRRPILPKEALE